MLERSYLFVPGDRPERFDKALASGAHAVILDLEDAVLPERKPEAREAIRHWLHNRASGPVWVRVNPEGTPWHDEDLSLLQAPCARGLMLPKAQDAVALQTLARRLQPGQQLIPLVETVTGWFEAEALARCSQVLRLAFGSVDFMADSGIQGDAEEMDAVRTHLVLVSRRANIQPPIDGVSLAIDDAQQLGADTARSRRFGFGGKLCIHPKQVGMVNQGFLPSPQQVAWAHRVVQALARGTAGAVTVDGKLVDRPVEILAQTILAEASQMQPLTPQPLGTEL